MDGHLDEKTSKCATYMNNVLVTMHRDSDLETRVAALEEDATP
jgi:hypothetical protein